LLVQFGSIREREDIFGKHYAPILYASESPGSNVVRGMLRHQNQVSVSHPISVNDHSHPLRREVASQSSPKSLGEHDYPLRSGVVEIGEMVNMCRWDHEALAGRDRTDPHEGHNGVITIDHTGWGTALDNVAKDTGHGFPVEMNPPNAFASAARAPIKS
jgi:hypothetical protein